MRYKDLQPATLIERDHGARDRQELYLVALEAGKSVKEAAAAAGMKMESVPYWRVRYPRFAERERALRDAAEVDKAAKRLRLCVCGKTFTAKSDSQEFCSRSCATRELKSASWSRVDTAIMNRLKHSPATRRELVHTTGVKLSWVRSVLNRLARRKLIKRIGAKRGLYAKWALMS